MKSLTCQQVAFPPSHRAGSRGRGGVQLPSTSASSDPPLYEQVGWEMFSHLHILLPV